ncbi:zinc finger domain-containing protein [Streptacidiphilus cavernicola]|uniref:DNA-binding phage zinc finger domain-containing protein n=1 Tax=Streptacidiphilus cavernicola TaxID=3342716 RepID=A0ABV6W467_9ACTN
MNPTEASQLLGRAAMFDNRKPSAGAAIAWAEALHDVPLDQDALAAVAAYYGAPGEPGERRWLQPHHVRHFRSLPRGERITAANLRYDGHPDETAEESVTNLRALITAAGDGRIAPRPLRALEPAEQAAITSRARIAIEAVKAIGEEATQGLPSRREGVVNVLGVPCPICRMPVGKNCRSRRSKHRGDVHPGRLEDARRIAAGLPPVDPSNTAIEERQRHEAARRALELSGPTVFIPPTRAEVDEAS